MTIYIPGWMNAYLGTIILIQCLMGWIKHSIDSVQGMDENRVVKHLQIWMNIK
jgi:hypothetical protein